MKRLFVFFVGALLLACEENDLGLKSNPIDSTILIETREVLEPASRRLTFFCKTQRIYSCINFPLLAETEITNNAFNVTFTKVGESMLCLTALGPAATVIDFNTVPNGDYAIEFNNANLKNKGQLKVTDNDITLFFLQTNGIELIRSTTRRVPPNTYWGTIGYHVASSGELADEFIQKFAEEGAAFNKQTPGHYFYYEIDYLGKIVANPENSGYYFMKAFIFQFDGNVAELKNLVELEGKNYNTALTINLQTYQGEQFNNWSIKR